MVVKAGFTVIIIMHVPLQVVDAGSAAGVVNVVASVVADAPLEDQSSENLEVIANIFSSISDLTDLTVSEEVGFTCSHSSLD